MLCYMGPTERIRAIGGGSVDQVPRLREFRKRCPQVMITSPRQNGSFLWRAAWTEPGLNPDDEGAVTETTHSELRFLLDALDKRFPPG